VVVYQLRGAQGMKKILQFFRNSYAELRRVVWPSREQVASSTKVVIVSTLLFALVLGVVDFILLKGIDLIF
jgi:preprotein translocase subunit SecE